jgi:hypothetical protein
MRVTLYKPKSDRKYWICSVSGSEYGTGKTSNQALHCSAQNLLLEAHRLLTDKPKQLTKDAQLVQRLIRAVVMESRDLNWGWEANHE